MERIDTASSTPLQPVTPVQLVKFSSPRGKRRHKTDRNPARNTLTHNRVDKIQSVDVYRRRHVDQRAEECRKAVGPARTGLALTRNFSTQRWRPSARAGDGWWTGERECRADILGRR